MLSFSKEPDNIKKQKEIFKKIKKIYLSNKTLHKKIREIKQLITQAALYDFELLIPELVKVFHVFYDLESELETDETQFLLLSNIISSF